MGTQTKSFMNDLPSWAKGVLVVAVISGVTYVSFKIYKKLNKTDKEKADKDILTNTEAELKANTTKGFKLTYPASQYPAFANQIYEGMKYAVGDDYGSVRDILMKMKNDLDVNAVTKAFGTRQAYAFGFPVGEKKDLFTFVRSELGSEYGGITSYKMDAINKDWALKGIKYRF